MSSTGDCKPRSTYFYDENNVLRCLDCREPVIFQFEYFVVEQDLALAIIEYIQKLRREFNLSLNEIKDFVQEKIKI